MTDISEHDYNIYFEMKSKSNFPIFMINEYKKILKNRKTDRFEQISSKKQFYTLLSNNDFKRVYINLIRLLTKFIALNDAQTLIKSISSNNMSDEAIYDIIKTKIRERKQKRLDIQYRDVRHSEQYVYYIKKNIQNFNLKAYLDIGCGECKKSMLIGNKLGLSNNNIYGADLEKWSVYDKEARKSLPIKLKIIKDDGLLPFYDKSLGLVSAFMVLHHVNKLDVLLKEINRITIDGGYFVIKEHDAMTYADHMLTDIEHGIYEISIVGNKKYFNDYYNRYRDKFEWEIIISRYGFKMIDIGYDFGNVLNEISPTRYFYAIFKKI